jgi:phospholipase C
MRALLVAAITVVATAHTIKHVVVLMEENRSFDHLLGWAGATLGVDGLDGTEWNPTSSLDPAASRRVYVDNNASHVAHCDPDHDSTATTAKLFGVKNTLDGNFSNETMSGFVETELLRSLLQTDCKVMSMFDPAKVPVLLTLAQEFCIMDKFFASVPGPTWPNRQFAMAATSGGNTNTNNWYQGSVGTLFPQPTIFDQLESANLTWRHGSVGARTFLLPMPPKFLAHPVFG